MKIHIRADHKLPIAMNRKSTECAALLHFHFNHSPKCKESIVFSQALAYNLLITDDTLLMMILGIYIHTHTLVGPSGSKQSNYVILPTARKASITSYKHLIG